MSFSSLFFESTLIEQCDLLTLLSLGNVILPIVRPIMRGDVHIEMKNGVGGARDDGVGVFSPKKRSISMRYMTKAARGA